MDYETSPDFKSAVEGEDDDWIYIYRVNCSFKYNLLLSTTDNTVVSREIAEVFVLSTLTVT